LLICSPHRHPILLTFCFTHLAFSCSHWLMASNWLLVAKIDVINAKIFFVAFNRTCDWCVAILDAVLISDIMLLPSSPVLLARLLLCVSCLFLPNFSLLACIFCFQFFCDKKKCVHVRTAKYKVSTTVTCWRMTPKLQEIQQSTNANAWNRCEASPQHIADQCYRPSTPASCVSALFCSHHHFPLLNFATHSPWFPLPPLTLATPHMSIFELLVFRYNNKALSFLTNVKSVSMITICF